LEEGVAAYVIARGYEQPYQERGLVDYSHDHSHEHHAHSEVSHGKYVLEIYERAHDQVAGFNYAMMLFGVGMLGRSAYLGVRKFFRKSDECRDH
jgi:hypothetical protein